MELLFYIPAIIPIVVAVVLCIALRKKDNPAKTAIVFAVIALAFGVIHITLEFHPFEYSGETGIDYIGQALVWALAVNSILVTSLAAYFSFAIAATIYSVKAIKNKSTRKMGIVSLIMSWICGILIASLITANVITDKMNKKNIVVSIEKVVSVTDTDGDPAVIVYARVTNNSQYEITYLSAVYDEVTQDGKELSYAIVEITRNDSDFDIKHISPGESLVVPKSYKLRFPGEEVHIRCTSYGGDVVYLDGDYIPDE